MNLDRVANIFLFGKGVGRMTARTLIKGAGALFSAGVAWLLVHFHINIIPKDETGAAAYTFAVYVLTSIFHVKLNGNGKPPAPIARVLLVPFLAAALALPAGLAGQGTRAAIDSAQRHALELGTDLRMRTDSVTEPVRVRAGLALGPRITVEYTATVAREKTAAGAGYFEAAVSLGVTAALTSGANRFSGMYVAPSILYRYEGDTKAAQVGVGLELGKRMQIAPNIIVRPFMFMDDYFATRRLPGLTPAGVGAGGSFGI